MGDKMRRIVIVAGVVFAATPAAMMVVAGVLCWVRLIQLIWASITE